ncbi:MAG: hypothetical protein LBS57_05660, partial [Treponema sp.]|nr:hypothetical protein [Treponema sp.]
MSDIYDPASPEFQNLAELARKRREEINQFSAQIRAEEQARRDYYKALREEKYRDWPSLLNDSDYDFLETAQTVIDNPSFEGDRELERDRLYATAFYAGKLHHPMRAVFLNLDEYHKQWTGQNFTRKTGIQAVIDSVGFSMESARYNHLTKQWANAGGKNDDPLLEEINESSRRIERLKDHAPKVWEDEYISQGGGADIFAFLRSAFVTTGENFVPLAAGIGVGALAATGVGALGTAAGLSAKAAGLIAVGASKTAIGANTYSSGWGTKYKQFRDEGFPHDISLKWAKIDEAMAGAVEGAIGGIESAAIAGIVKNVAPTLASRAINKLFIKGKLGAAAKTTLKILAQAGEEGVLEEIPQGLGSGWARNMAVDEANARRAEQYEKRMAELEERYQKLGEPITASVMEEFDRYMNENYPEMKKEEWDDILKGALQDGIAAFSSTLITGGMGEAFGAIRHKGTFGKTIRSSQQLAEMAKDSLNVAELAEKVDAAKKAGYEPPYSEGLKTEAEAALLSDIYKAQQERLTPEEREDRQLKARGAEALAEVTDYSNADVEDVAELDERGKPTGDTAPEFFTNAEGDIFRENGRLETAEYTEEAEGGGIEGRFVAGDPRKPEADGNRYGYINYTEKDGAVTIDEFKMLAGYEKLRGGLYRQFAETHAGQNIIWNPKNEGNIALREEIAANNPRGPKYGLDYFEDAGQSAASAEATRAARRFAPYLKNSTPLETALAVETFGSFYRRRGESLDGAMNRLIGKVTNEAPDAVAAAQRAGKTVKGATWIEQTAEGARRIIYVSKNAADGSTVVHEISHAVAADFTEAERNIAARALNGYRLKSGTRVSFEENAAWGEEQQEAFAEALENYLTNGTAPNEEIKGLFERIKEFMGRIYRTMKGWTELSPQAEAFYQSLLSGELVDRA